MESSAIYTSNKLIRFGVSILPDHMKRLLFLIGLTDTRHIDTEDKAVAAKLNQVLNLVNHESAIGSAVFVKSLLWVDPKKYEEEVLAQFVPATGEESDSVRDWARRIVVKMPAWLVYNDPSAMVDDVIKVLMLRPA